MTMNKIIMISNWLKEIMINLKWNIILLKCQVNKNNNKIYNQMFKNKNNNKKMKKFLIDNL